MCYRSWYVREICLIYMATRDKHEEILTGSNIAQMTNVNCNMNLHNWGKHLSKTICKLAVPLPMNTADTSFKVYSNIRLLWMSYF